MALDILRNAVPIIDGRRVAGSSMIQLTKIKAKTEKLYMGGSDGETEVELGLQALDAKFKLFTVNPDVLALSGLRPGVFKTFSFNGATVSEVDGGTVGVTARISGKIADDDPGDWKAGDKTEWDYRILVRTYRLKIGTRTVYDIDPLNFVRIIDGVDQLAAMRAAMQFD